MNRLLLSHSESKHVMGKHQGGQKGVSQGQDKNKAEREHRQGMTLMTGLGSTALGSTFMQD